jgi:hypothetical protein
MRFLVVVFNVYYEDKFGKFSVIGGKVDKLTMYYSLRLKEAAD